MLEFAPIFDRMKSRCKLCPGALTLSNHRTTACVAILLLFCSFAFAQNPATGSTMLPQISRPVRTWEFMPVVGRKAAIFGNESGKLEAWVYPMKFLRDFSLVFHLGDRSFPAASLARNIEVRPEAVTITYANESFTVRETIFVPREEPGAIIDLAVDSHTPVSIEARFQPDFQLMWPAAIGGTYTNWDDKLHAFTFGEEQKKWFGMIGSASAERETSSFDTNYFAEHFDSFVLPAITKRDHRLIVVSGSTTSAADAQATYQRLTTSYDRLREESVAQYREYLASTLSLSLPDAELQSAYDWSRVSVWQGMVTNPFLGTGLVAGYRTSGTSARPGFAWFFGRDSEWTSLALNSEGDYQGSRQALDFISKYQRADGKIPHEISQAAKQVPWFTDFPYPWASADATPLFIIAVRDYFQHSGDTEFVSSHWDNIWRAYQFLNSTRDARGLPQNLGVGHGWIEGGPLLPVKTEFYQTGLGAEATRSLSVLARVVGKSDIAAEALRAYETQAKQLNDLFWDPEGKYFAYALDPQGQRLNTASVLTTVPMWFALTDDAKSQSTITELAGPDHETDWGMRIVSARDPRFDPSGYHFGSVWPLFTGWASVGEYRYHRPLPAYDNLRANALLALAGSAGHVTEVLSGSYFEGLSTSSPHQIWSAAMVISPMLRGLLGIEADAENRVLRLAPHTPADWTWWKARNVRIGKSTADIDYEHSTDAITLNVSPRGGSGISLEFSPAISPRAKVMRVEVNGRPAKFDVQKTSTDQHVKINLPLASASTVRIHVVDDFQLVLRPELPPLGATSRNIRILNETWNSASSEVSYDIAGIAGHSYDIPLRGFAGATVDGAQLVNNAAGAILRVTISDASGTEYGRARVTIHFPRGR
jgi:glycogen debranching enzyme